MWQAFGLAHADSKIKFARCDACQHEIGIEAFTQENHGNPTPAALFKTDGVDFADLAKKALRERIIISCLHCNGKLKVARRMIGQQINCVLCGKAFEVPNLGEEDDFDKYLEPTAAAHAQLSGNISVLARSGRRENMNRAQFKHQVITLAIAAAAAIILAFVGFSVFKDANTTKTPADNVATEGGGDKQTPQPEIPPKTGWTDKVPTDADKTRTPENTDNSRSGAGDKTQNAGNQTGKTEQYLISASAPLASWSNLVPNTALTPRPGYLFLTINLELDPGEYSQKFENFGKFVKLRIGREIYYSLGSPPKSDTESFFPATLIQQKTRLARDFKTKVKCIFELPARSATGVLEVATAKPIKVRIEFHPRFSKTPGGQFAEMLPRRLKPVLNDPIMSAIQSAVGNKLNLTRIGDSESEGAPYEISIPQADVAGKVLPTKTPGVYDLKLTQGSYKLSAKLYIFPDNSQCVLYLADMPGYRLRYRRTSSSELDFNAPESYTAPFKLAQVGS